MISAIYNFQFHVRRRHLRNAQAKILDFHFFSKIQRATKVFFLALRKQMLNSFATNHCSCQVHNMEEVEAGWRGLGGWEVEC